MKTVLNKIVLEALLNSLECHKGDKWRFTIGYTKRLAWKNQKNKLEQAIKIMTEDK